MLSEPASEFDGIVMSTANTNKVVVNNENLDSAPRASIGICDMIFAIFSIKLVKYDFNLKDCISYSSFHEFDASRGYKSDF